VLLRGLPVANADCHGRNNEQANKDSRKPKDDFATAERHLHLVELESVRLLQT
jgi:hypothetical protein